METNQAPAQEIARKITLRTCGCTVEAIKAATADMKEGESVELLKIAGVTTSCSVGQTDKGEFIRLRGEFLAMNQSTGEQFTAAECILPTFLGQTLQTALVSSEQVEFALSIGARKIAKSVTGYEFVARPLVNAEPSSRLSKLIAAAGLDKPLALAAPKAATEEAPAKGKKAA
jgi:hypothetical protein